MNKKYHIILKRTQKAHSNSMTLKLKPSTSRKPLNFRHWQTKSDIIVFFDINLGRQHKEQPLRFNNLGSFELTLEFGVKD